MDTLMDSLLPILLIVAVALALLTVFAKLAKRGVGATLYKRSDELFSPAERKFLITLDAATAPRGRVFGKVRVADLIDIKSGLNPKVRQIALNRVAQKHFDFVVCASDSLIPLCAVELNDSSHSSQRAQRRDEFLEGVCSSIGLPLITIKAAGSYSVDSLREQITTAIGPPR